MLLVLQYCTFKNRLYYSECIDYLTIDILDKIIFLREYQTFGCLTQKTESFIKYSDNLYTDYSFSSSQYYSHVHLSQSYYYPHRQIISCVLNILDHPINNGFRNYSISKGLIFSVIFNHWCPEYSNLVIIFSFLLSFR